MSVFLSPLLSLFSFEAFEGGVQAKLYRHVHNYDPQEEIAIEQYSRSPTAIAAGPSGFYVYSTMNYVLNSSKLYSDVVPYWVYHPKSLDEFYSVFRSVKPLGALARWLQPNLDTLPEALYELTRKPFVQQFYIASYSKLTQQHLHLLQTEFRLQGIRGDTYTVWSTEKEPYALLEGAKAVQIETFFHRYDFALHSFVRPFSYVDTLEAVSSLLKNIFQTRNMQQRNFELKQAVIEKV